MTIRPTLSPKQLLEAVQDVAREIAAKHADDVDARARFPSETIAALKGLKVLSAAVPAEFGGGGFTMRELAGLCSALAQGCSSSAMVLAMHYSQLACIVRHGMGSAFFRQYIKDLVEHQYLLASMTSEV